LNVATSCVTLLLLLLLSLGALVISPARQVLDGQDHHAFRTHWLRKLRVFASAEATERENEEEVGDKEEREDGQSIKNVDGNRSSRWGRFPRFDCLKSEISW